MGIVGPMKKLYYVREFLNRPSHHTNAFVLAEVEETDDGALNSTLSIGDCFRKIHLSLDWGDDDRILNTVFKLRLLANVVTRVSDIITDKARAKGIGGIDRVLEAADKRAKTSP